MASSKRPLSGYERALFRCWWEAGTERLGRSALAAHWADQIAAFARTGAQCPLNQLAAAILLPVDPGSKIQLQNTSSC